MAQFYKYFLKDEIRNSSDNKITRQLLMDLDFQEVLENRWRWLANPDVRTDGEIYVTFLKDGDCYIEGNSMVGNARYGNNFIAASAGLNELLTIVELLKL